MATATETPWRNRIVASAEVDPATLTANPRNWRTHPSRQKAALRGALGSVGWVQQVIVNRVTGHLVDGHARIEEALARGESRVPVLYVDIAPEEEALVLATLDPLGAMAEADTPKLNELLAGISVDDAGLRLLLGSLSGPEERREGLTDPDDVPSLASSTDLQTGELWQLGHHRLLIGDATSAPDVARVVGEDLVDMIWTGDRASTQR